MMRAERITPELLSHAIVDGINSFVREVLTPRCPPLGNAWNGVGSEELDRLKYEIARTVAEKWAVSWVNDEVSLRDVQVSDLPVFFEQQCDPESTRMAGFPARTYDEFMAHWAKSMADETTILKTIVFDGNVAGNIVCWEQPGERKVGYWLGKEYWGKGFASAALAQFLGHVKYRPLYARVAKRNVASIRVLQKCGFRITGEDTFRDIDGEPVSEFIMTLEAHSPDEKEST